MRFLRVSETSCHSGFSCFRVLRFWVGVEVARWRLDVLMEMYPDRRLVPFAARYDNDDLACFEVGFGGRVFIVYMGADPGWERRQEYDDFWDWFQVAVDELIEEDRRGNDDR